MQILQKKCLPFGEGVVVVVVVVLVVDDVI